MYLLKVERKVDETANVNIGSKYEYREFDKLEPMIKYLFDNALYIKNYSIRKLKQFEDQDRSYCVNRDDQSEGSVRISSSNSFGNFN